MSKWVLGLVDKTNPRDESRFDLHPGKSLCLVGKPTDFLTWTFVQRTKHIKDRICLVRMLCNAHCRLEQQHLTSIV